MTFKQTSSWSEKGAVSIFIVLFTALLVSIVTASFVQVMLRNQQQASNNDLSQSAYDSALAGVEDAKRALVALKACANKISTDPDYASCNSLRSELVNNGGDCKVLGSTNVGVSTFKNDEEVIVGDEALNQAYTCVTMQINTKSYEGTLKANESVLIPLDSVGATNSITGVRISWFMQGDIPTTDVAGNPVTRTPGYPTPILLLPRQADWAKNYPSLMRSQLIQFNEGQLNLTDFDTPGGANNNSKTLFLFPGTGGDDTLDFATDARRTANVGSAPELAKCSTGFDQNGSYACSTRVAVPALAAAGTKQAYLQLRSLYNDASYKVELCDNSSCGGNLLDFENVQPIVDSTGRASDLFRRIRARIAISEKGTPDTYPEAALYINKSLCKDFSITNDSYEGDTDSIACSADN